MPQVLMSGMVGAPRSLTDALYLTHAPATPLSSKLRHGESINQEIHTFKVGRPGDTVDDATPDGQPPAPTGGKDPEYEADARVGFFESTPRVGKFAKHKKVVGQTTSINKGGKNPGTGAPHLAMARAQHLQRIKRGIEKRLLGDGDSAGETGTVAAKFRGLGVWIAATAPTDRPYDVTIATPAAQIFSGAATSTFAESSLQALLQARWEATGYSSELLGLVGSKLKTQIGTFNRRVPTVSNYESVIRYPSGSAKTVMQGVDMFEGDYGMVEFMLDFFVPATSRGYVLDMDHMEARDFGPGTEEEDLGNDGGGQSKVLRAMLTMVPGDPRAHIKINPND